MKAWSWVGVWSLASLGQKGPPILRASSSYVPSPFFSLASLPLRLNGEPRPEGFLGLGTLSAKTRTDRLIGHLTPTVIECPKNYFLILQVKL